MHIPTNILNIIIALGIPIGIAQCFFGFRIFMFLLGLIGFVIGAVLAGGLGYAISPHIIIAIIAGFIGGFIGAAIMVGLYLLGVFLTGAFFGGLLGLLLSQVFHSDPIVILIIILAIIGGIVALALQKFLIIISTAFGGAWIVVTGVAYFTFGVINHWSIDRFYRYRGGLFYIMILFWIALGIFGTIYQYKTAPIEKTGDKSAIKPKEKEIVSDTEKSKMDQQVTSA